MGKRIVYKLVNSESLVRYVGCTQDIKKRKSEHSKKYPLYTFEILEEVSKSNWKERERFWISYFREKGHPLLNVTDGGDGGKSSMPQNTAKEIESIVTDDDHIVRIGERKPYYKRPFPVIQYREYDNEEMIEVERYGSLTEAANCTGINRKSISQCCNGKQKYAGGYVFKYDTETKLIIR